MSYLCVKNYVSVIPELVSLRQFTLQRTTGLEPAIPGSEDQCLIH